MNLNKKQKKILILCTGNSCRSQMAEGFANQTGWDAYSAGTKPEIEINPFAVKVMIETGIDISNHIPNLSINTWMKILISLLLCAIMPVKPAPYLPADQIIRFIMGL